MAHRILGIDLGAYSVKVVVATAGLRSASVVEVYEAPVPAGDEPVEDRAVRALAGLVAAHGLEHDIPHWTMQGDEISVRVLDFSFAGVKRAEMERAVGGELEGVLPHDLEELVYDFDVMPREDALAAIAVTPDDPTNVAAVPARPAPGGGAAAHATGTKILAAATTKERVRHVLGLGAAHQLESRSLVAAPMSYLRVLERAGLGAAEPIMVVDIGHARTNLMVAHKGRALYARTLSRGGKQITQAISRAWTLPWDQAEAAKHSDGFVASTAEPAQSAAWERISEVVTAELQPLLRELRQTLSACKSQAGAGPRRVLLCGGGGRLRGLASWMTEQLELPVVHAGDFEAQLLGPTLAARGGVAIDHALPALGAALEAASGRPAFDLRKGEFAYRADFSFLRQRAGFLTGLALVVVAFAAVNAYAALYKLRAEEKILDEQLRVASTEVFGAPATPEEVEEKVGPAKKTESPLPKMTAFDQLVEISRRVPPRDKAKLEVAEIDIRKDKITIRATTDSAASIDEIEKRLKEVECFSEVARGKVQSGSADEKTFNLTITSKCM